MIDKKKSAAMRKAMGYSNDEKEKKSPKTKRPAPTLSVDITQEVADIEKEQEKQKKKMSGKVKRDGATYH